MTQQTRGIPGKFFPYAVPDQDTRITIAERAVAGESITALADEFHISTRTVMRYRDALGGE
ncbi:helix-turn-helix domain-containing protein [Mycobacteroides chelonae]|uniref:helix-turn-helix domain-containing protein n=1 Tax=Mycobacteroides chelonae TaxID=1774 RepID=UPI0018B09DC5|nr:helix-turn-helix domain-containing protein [Mycobacteroides chelonae]MBF9519539.1 hypothetical protein [Mycobacteroides chelonae]